MRTSIEYDPKPNWNVPTNEPDDAAQAEKEKEHELHKLENDSSDSDEGELNPNVDFAAKMIKSMRVLRVLMYSCGRLPLIFRPIDDGMFTFFYSKASLHFLFFCFTTFLIFLIMFIGLLNLFLIAFDQDRQPARLSAIFPLGRLEKRVRDGVRLRELVVVKRYLVLLLLFGSGLIQSAISSIVIIRRREYFANYFGFWTRSIQTIQIDVTKNVRSFTIMLCVSYLVIVVVFLILYVADVASSFRGGSVVGAVVLFRLFAPAMLKPADLDRANYDLSESLRVCESLGLVVFIANLMWSSVYLFLYLTKAKMLRNAFAYWNGRVYAAVLRNDFTRTKKARTTFPLLFKDHCVLLDLLDGTNTLFAGIIESFYALQVTCLLFLFYFFIRILRVGNNVIMVDSKFNQDVDYYKRRNDLIPATYFLSISLSFIYMMSHVSFDVADEAAAGLEVIRRKSMIGRSTDEELYFVLSLFSSYTSYDSIEMSGGAFFGVNKELWMGIIGVIASLLVIMYHLQPVFDHTDKARRKEIGMFLHKLEGIDNCSWVATSKLHKGPTYCDLTNTTGTI